MLWINWWRNKYIRVWWHGYGCCCQRLWCGRCWSCLLACITPQLGRWCSALDHISLHSECVGYVIFFFNFRIMSFGFLLNLIWKKILLNLRSALIERVFLMAPLHDMRRRNCRGLNVVWRTLTVLLWLNERNRCSFKYACTSGFRPVFAHNTKMELNYKIRKIPY